MASDLLILAANPLTFSKVLCMDLGPLQMHCFLRPDNKIISYDKFNALIPATENYITVVLSYAGYNPNLVHYLCVELINLIAYRDVRIKEDLANKLAENGKKIMKKVAEELDEHTVESINITCVRRPLKCLHFADSAEDSD
jgi:hypothetical protein